MDFPTVPGNGSGPTAPFLSLLGLDTLFLPALGVPQQGQSNLRSFSICGFETAPDTGLVCSVARSAAAALSSLQCMSPSLRQGIAGTPSAPSPSIRPSATVV